MKKEILKQFFYLYVVMMSFVFGKFFRKRPGCIFENTIHADFSMSRRKIFWKRILLLIFGALFFDLEEKEFFVFSFEEYLFLWENNREASLEMVT